MHHANRLIVVHSPKSTNAHHYEKQVRPELRKMFSDIHEVALDDVGYFDARTTISDIIKDGDTVAAAGGDGIVNVALDAALSSGRNATFAAIPLGNFNDFSRTVNGNVTDIHKILSGPIIDFHPLELSVNGNHCLYAGQYITLGASAKLTDFLNSPRARELRKKVRGNGTLFGTLCVLNYRKIFSSLGDMSKVLPPFNRKGTKYHDNNIGFMLGAIGTYFHPGAGTMHLASNQFWFHRATLTGKALKDVPYITSWFGRNVPGELSDGESITFEHPINLTAQVGGDKLVLKSVTTLSCKRSRKSLKLLAPNVNKML